MDEKTSVLLVAYLICCVVLNCCNWVSNVHRGRKTIFSAQYRWNHL